MNDRYFYNDDSLIQNSDIKLNLKNMEDLFDLSMNDEQFNPLDDLQSNPLSNNSPSDDDLIGGVFNHKGLSPFDSGFDADHPMPTYDQLKNAGFSDYLAHQITGGLSHCYSQRELFHCLYESEDPVKAYNEMMDAKAQDSIEKADKLIQEIESGLL